MKSKNKKNFQNRIFIFLFLIFSELILFLSACGPTPDDPSNININNQPMDYDANEFFRKKSMPFKGVTLHGISENADPSIYIKEVLAPQFEIETGIKIELQITGDWDLLYDKTLENIANNTSNLDFIYVEQDFIYSFIDKNLLTNLSTFIRQNPDLISPEFKISNFTSFINFFIDGKDDLFGIPIESFIFVYLYRKDLFNDRDIQKEFFEKYNYPLSPAITVQQYLDISKFFTNYGKRNNLELWGTTVQGVQPSVHYASWYELFHGILPLFGVYNWGINTETLYATVANGGMLNSDAAKKALKFWLEIKQWSPPESSTSDWGTISESMAQGRTAQGFIYGDNISWICTDENRSKVTGKIGVALPPTVEGVLSEAKAGKGYIGYYDGAAFSIPKISKKKKAAFLWLQFLSKQSIQMKWTASTARIVTMETFDQEKLQNLDKQLGGYFSHMKKYGPLYSGNPPFPFHAELRETILPYIEKAMNGVLSPSEALERAAEESDVFLLKQKKQRK